LDKSKLRPLQRNAHLKIADCYGMKNASSDEVQRCVQINSQIMQQIDQIVNGEIQNFQNRVQRCANTCQDDFQSDNYNNKSGVPTESSQKKLIGCFTSCVDKSISTIKPMQSKLEGDIDSLTRGH
jgi:hypothetical protein